MPINKYIVLGDLEASGTFNALRETKSKLIFQNPKAVDKIRHIWNKVPYKFNFCFSNQPTTDKKYVNDTLREIDYVEDDAINVVMTHNSTGTHYMPMTAWIMAHRLEHLMLIGRHLKSNTETHVAENKLFSTLMMTAHAFGMTTNDESSLRHYGQMSTNLLDIIERESLYSVVNKIFTMRSAREGMIDNVLDIMAELLAQYLITGDIKFNNVPNHISYEKEITIHEWNAKFSKKIESHSYKLSNKAAKKLDVKWEELRNDLKVYFDTCLANNVGKLLIW